MNFLGSPFLVGNMFNSFAMSDGFGKAIVIGLLAGSIWVWSILSLKVAQLRGFKKRSDQFLRKYRNVVDPIDLLGEVDAYLPTPLASIYEATGEQLLKCLRNDSEQGMSRLTDTELEAVRARSDREMADQILVIEKDMAWLTTGATAAPFIGLLGTVLGVMSAFEGMGTGGAMMLQDVAPGIASALLTTVVGLIVALPCAIGYNYNASLARTLTVEMENFVDELYSDISLRYRAGERG